MGDRYYRPPDRGARGRAPSSSPSGSRPYDTYRPGYQGRADQHRHTPQPPYRTYDDSTHGGYPRHATPSVRNRGRPYPPEDTRRRVRDLPRDHPLMLEMERFKDDRHKRSLRWINFARHLGEEWEQPRSYNRIRFQEEEQKAETRLQDLAAMIALERRGMLEEDPEYGRERPLYHSPPPIPRKNARPPKAGKAVETWTQKKATVSVKNWMKQNNSLALEKEKKKPKPQVPVIIGDGGSDDGIPDNESMKEAPLPSAVADDPNSQGRGQSKTSGLQGSRELRTAMQTAEIAISDTTTCRADRAAPYPAMDLEDLELLAPAEQIESSHAAPFSPASPSDNLGEHRMETDEDGLPSFPVGPPSANLGKHRMDVESDQLLNFSSKRHNSGSHAGVVDEMVNYAASTSPAARPTSSNVPNRQGSNSFDMAASLRDAKRQADVIASAQPPSSSPTGYGHQRGREENTSMPAVASLPPISSIDWDQLWSALHK